MSDHQTVNLDGVSTRDLENDVVSITFEATKDGKSADAVQKELREAVQAALEVVRPHIVPEQVEVETDSFQVQPRFNKSNKIDGYIGIASIIVKGTNATVIAQLASDIKTMMVAGSRNSMSLKLRQSVEADLMREAIVDFQSKADAVTNAFGFKSWAISSVSVSTHSSSGRSNHGKVMALGGSASYESAPQQVESGKSTMTAQVRGSISLLRTKKA